MKEVEKLKKQLDTVVASFTAKFFFRRERESRQGAAERPDHDLSAAGACSRWLNESFRGREAQLQPRRQGWRPPRQQGRDFQ